MHAVLDCRLKLPKYKEEDPTSWINCDGSEERRRDLSISFCTIKSHAQKLMSSGRTNTTFLRHFSSKQATQILDKLEAMKHELKVSTRHNKRTFIRIRKCTQ